MVTALIFHCSNRNWYCNWLVLWTSKLYQDYGRDSMDHKTSIVGTIKVENSPLIHNVFVINNKVFYSTKYYKARASTNFSYFILWYLLLWLSKLILIYITYIHLILLQYVIQSTMLQEVTAWLFFYSVMMRPFISTRMTTIIMIKCH